MGTVKVTSRLPDRVVKEIRVRAEKEDRSFNWMISNILSTALTSSVAKKPKGLAVAKFIKPTQADLHNYANEKGLRVDGFLDYYQANGWKVGKNPMKDWKAAVRNWNKNSAKFSKNDSVDTSGQNWVEMGTKTMFD